MPDTSSRTQAQQRAAAAAKRNAGHTTPHHTSFCGAAEVTATRRRWQVVSDDFGVGGGHSQRDGCAGVKALSPSAWAPMHHTSPLGCLHAPVLASLIPASMFQAGAIAWFVVWRCCVACAKLHR